MLSAHLLAFSLVSIGSGVVRQASEFFFGQLTTWVAAGAASLLKALGGVLTSSTTPDLSAGFSAEFSVMSLIGAMVALPLLLVAAIRAIIHQDVVELARAALLRLPAAVLLTAAAVELVRLALQASDEMSSALLSAAGHPVERLIGTLVAGLASAAVATGPPGIAIGGFGALLLALVAAVVAFVLWLELVVRSAAVAVATLFLPLALAGIVWPATAHWARRLAETLTALVLAKVVVAGTLALAGVTLTSGAGVASLVEGIALLLLATAAPFVVLRLVPMVEGGAVGHLDGLGRRSVHSAIGGATAAAGLGSDGLATARGVVGRLSGDGPTGTGSGGATRPGGGGPRGPRPGGGTPVVDDVPFMAGMRVDTPEILADAEAIARSLPPLEEPA